MNSSAQGRRSHEENPQRQYDRSESHSNNAGITRECVGVGEREEYVRPVSALFIMSEELKSAKRKDPGDMGPQTRPIR